MCCASVLALRVKIPKNQCWLKLVEEYGVHPWKLTWNLKITQFKRTIIFQTSIFGGSMLIFQGGFGIVAAMLVRHASLDLWASEKCDCSWSWANYVGSRNWSKLKPSCSSVAVMGNIKILKRKVIRLNRTSKHNSSMAIAVHKDPPCICCGKSIVPREY